VQEEEDHLASYLTVYLTVLLAFPFPPPTMTAPEPDFDPDFDPDAERGYALAMFSNEERAEMTREQWAAEDRATRARTSTFGEGNAPRRR
jgi:hypothetical protein